jgi:TetR/AcrR family transcriptional regulator, regulator of cefoperazone and chloramphenicol sensitivity
MQHNVMRQRPGSYARGEDTRRRILDTALEIFAAEGYEGASTRLLAERAGVNLPAIQYYFGSKEGLYRAVIEHIIGHTEAHMAPLAVRVSAALADPQTSREDLLELLCQMMESFVVLVTDGPQVESKRLLFARAEVEEAPGLERLHENGRQQIFQPCLDLTGRLLGQSTEEETTLLRTLALIGQATVFCHKGVRYAMKSSEFTPERVRAIQALVRSHIQAIMRDAMSTAPRQTKPDGCS